MTARYLTVFFFLVKWILSQDSFSSLLYAEAKRIYSLQSQNIILNCFAFLKDYWVLLEGLNSYFRKPLCADSWVGVHFRLKHICVYSQSTNIFWVSKHGDFMICPSLYISSTTKLKLYLELLDIARQRSTKF